MKLNTTLIKKWITVPFLLLACIACFFSTSHASERSYQLTWCAAHGGAVEVVMPNGTRADCITDTHAVEVDYAPKWAQAIGQSLNYATQTKKRAGIVLIVGPDDGRHVQRLMGTIQCLNIDVWTVNK